MEFCGWIEAAKAAGLKRRQIFLRHFFPTIWPRIVSRILLLLPAMLLLVVAADFSGLVEGGEGFDRWGILMAEGQGGLLDVVPHPNFADNRLLYLSYSKPDASGKQATTAVARGRFEQDRLTSVEVIFEALSRGRGHYGSRLAFSR